MGVCNTVCPMKTKNKEASLANAVVTQEVVKQYAKDIPVLAMEVRMMEANPEHRDSIELLRYYKKALQILVEHQELLARYAKSHGPMNQTHRQHPENGMD